jgi:hypothetical protein
VLLLIGLAIWMLSMTVLWMTLLLLMLRIIICIDKWQFVLWMAIGAVQAIRTKACQVVLTNQFTNMFMPTVRPCSLNQTASQSAIVFIFVYVIYLPCLQNPRAYQGHSFCLLSGSIWRYIHSSPLQHSPYFE